MQTAKLKRKKLVYISHPSSGLKENTLDIEKIIRELNQDKEFLKGHCVVSPVHNYGFMYNEVDYETGLGYCIDLLLQCDEMLVFGDYTNSKGCTREIEICKEYNIPYKIMGNSSELSDKLRSGILNK